MVKVKIRHLVEKMTKSGRKLFYWQPTAALRKHGFQSRPLPDDLAEAIAEAERLNRNVDAWRRGEELVPFQPETIPWLIRLYTAHWRFTKLTPTSQYGYRKNLNCIEKWSADRKHPPIKKIKRMHVFDFHSKMAHAPAKANAVIGMLQILLQFAYDAGYLEENPASEIKLERCKPRDQFWEDKQIEEFVKVAAENGRQSMGLAVLLAFNLGQREGDVLRLTWAQYDGDCFTIKQSKTQVKLLIPATAQLKAALSEAPRLSPTILVSEATGRPYKEDHFRDEFRRIAKLAEIPDDIRFMDLRRTCVVRLSEAGCNHLQISAITGHSPENVLRILKTYWKATEPTARRAIYKLDRMRTELEGKV